MTDKPTPTTDLLKRCAEIHEWRSTGVLSGEALRDYAKRKWPDRHDTLQMAEHETVTEALALLAKWGTPQPAPAPLSEMPYEKRKAIQEGEQIGASDAWFKARHEMLDTVDRRNVFRAGFDRGWNAALDAQGGKDE